MLFIPKRQFFCLCFAWEAFIFRARLRIYWVKGNFLQFIKNKANAWNAKFILTIYISIEMLRKRSFQKRQWTKNVYIFLPLVKKKKVRLIPLTALINDDDDGKVDWRKSRATPVSLRVERFGHYFMDS